MNALVGYTGFVGSNLYESGNFGCVYNSKNIAEAYGTKPDMLVYAGVRAEKYLANTAPQKDMALIMQAEENISRIAPKKLVLISTIDVFRSPINIDETSPVKTEGLHPYGHDRYVLETWARERYPDALIIRLPALFGKNIRKNFIYDYIHRIPFMLKNEKFEKLANADPELVKYYSLMENGFRQVKQLNDDERCILKEKFFRLGFSALNFTDSRNVYQFYPLNRLWSDIQIALEHDIKLLHPATEPISAGELFYYLCGEEFINELPGEPLRYDYRTVYDNMFCGRDGYISAKEEIKKEIKEFVKEQLT